MQHLKYPLGKNVESEIAGEEADMRSTPMLRLWFETNLGFIKRYLSNDRIIQKATSLLKVVVLLLLLSVDR